MVSGNPTAPELRFWSLESGEQTGVENVGLGTFFRYRGGRLFTLTSRSPDLSGPWVVRVWAPDGDGSREMGVWPAPGPMPTALDIDPSGRWLAFGRGEDVFLAPLSSPARERRGSGGSHRAPVTQVKFAPDGKVLISQDASGEARV